MIKALYVYCGVVESKPGVGVDSVLTPTSSSGKMSARKLPKLTIPWIPGCESQMILLSSKFSFSKIVSIFPAWHFWRTVVDWSWKSVVYILWYFYAGA